METESEYAVISPSGQVINVFHSFSDREHVQGYYPNCTVLPVSEVPGHMLTGWYSKRSA